MSDRIRIKAASMDAGRFLIVEAEGAKAVDLAVELLRGRLNPSYVSSTGEMRDRFGRRLPTVEELRQLPKPASRKPKARRPS